MSNKATLAAEAIAPRAKPESFIRRLADALTLRLHAIADRLDAVPDHYGDEGAIDETDAGAVRREWIRAIQAWAACSPEQVFAIKAGALALAAALALMLIVVAAI